MTPKIHIFTRLPRQIHRSLPLWRADVIVRSLYIMPTIVGAIFVLATADVLAEDYDLPASEQLTCVGCEAASNSFGYSTYAGQRALVTVNGTAEIGQLGYSTYAGQRALVTVNGTAEIGQPRQHQHRTSKE